MRGSMITVKPYRGSYTNGYTVEGHADYAEHGQDIVCAGVSALAQSTEFSLMRYANVESIASDGFLQVDVTNPNIYTHVLISSMVNGMLHIEDIYPQYLYVEKEKRT